MKRTKCMSNNYEFSIVVFAVEQEQFQMTYESLKDQTLKRDVQILVVPIEEAVFTENYLEQLKKDSYVTIVKPDSNGNIISVLHEHIKGKYVSFTKSGVMYDSKALKAVAQKGKNNSSIIIVPVKANVRRITVLREHNAYCDKYQPGTTLSTYANLLHRIYMGYFILTEKLCWQETFYVKYWYYNLINTIFETVIRTPDLVCMKKRLLCIQDGRDILAEEDAFYKEKEKFIEGYPYYLEKMLKTAEREGVLHCENVCYTLLYGAVQLMKMVEEQEELTEEQVETYQEYANYVLKERSFPKYVIENQYINKINKKYLLENYFSEAVNKDDEKIYNIVAADKVRTSIEILDFKNNSLHTELKIMFPYGTECTVYMSNGEQEVPLKKLSELKGIYWGRTQTGVMVLYEGELKLSKEDCMVQWNINTKKGKKILDNLYFNTYTPLYKGLALYVRIDKKLMYLNGNADGVMIVADMFKQRVPLFWKRTVSLIKRKVPGCKALFARTMYWYRKKRLHKQIWLVSDRTNRGDDNGEVMFRYLCEHGAADIEPYFVIDKDTPEWKILGKLGKVVAPFSHQHKQLFLLSEFSLSSQANKAVVNPFGKLSYLYRDLMYDKRLVFLQHGITKDNQSAWLNKYNRNLFGFIVTTQPEYDSVFEYEYFYKKDRVWLTGMPRYDRLYHDEKRYVTIMPTWRKSLSAGTDSAGVWLLGEEFAESDYFKFYNDLLNNEKLLTAAEQYGYTVCFMPHPNTIAGLDLFKHDKRVTFLDATNSYRDVFAQTNLMVTDYSSVAFDFAYLRKPIVYAQFDKEEFFNGEHSYTEGYFDYERDGFGEVEYSLDTVVERVIEYMKADCVMKEEYLKRIEETFAFNDQDCSKRVYETILKYRG